MYKLQKLAVYSNVWVALAVVCFTVLSYSELTVFSWDYLLFVFTSTIGAYNYMRIVQMPKELDEKNRQKFWMRDRSNQAMIFTMFFFSAALYFYIRLWSLSWILITSPAIIVSLLYPLGFKNPFTSFTSLRNIPGLKLFLISASWAYISYLIPVLVFGVFHENVFLEFFFRIFFVAALVIPFDIRDKSLDLDNMKTLPQKYGVWKSKFIAIIFVFAYLIWKFVQLKSTNIELELFVAWFISSLAALVLILRMNSKRSELYCGFWVEAIPIIGMLILIMQTHMLAFLTS